MSDQQLPPLAGKRAMVTGASRGIGREIALALARAGADVVVAARTEGDITHLAEEIRALGREAWAFPCDVTDPEAVERMAAEALRATGGVDVLVNNAGASGSAKFAGHPDELWHRMLAINLTGVYYVCKAFVPAMIQRRGGRIVNIASTAARSGSRYIAAYVASKHGVLGLTRAIAAELVAYEITVNAICPGYVDTPMTDGTVANIIARTGMTEEATRAFLAQSSPQGRLIEPGEVAALAVFLAGDAAKGITGQAINIDGGALMS
jgi:NAD(P)-dependent dehydrogenase (short-subunit alcohol dehydrogenase family)